LINFAVSSFTSSSTVFNRYSFAWSDELEGQVKVGKVNVDEEAALALKYQIMSIPTLVVMKKGVFEGKSIGVQDKDEVLRLLAL
jgi:thioredoxin 1